MLRNPDRQIAILYWADPWASLPSGIDSFIRGMLKYAPDDLSYTLLGASADERSRPLLEQYVGQLGKTQAHVVPLISLDEKGRRTKIPATLRYMSALIAYARTVEFKQFKVLDFHRVEPSLLFLRSGKKKNVVIHQDMANIRNAGSDIGWRFAPALYDFVERPLLRNMDQIYCVRQSAVDRYRVRDHALAGRVHFTPTWMDTEIFACDPSQVVDGQYKRMIRKQLNVPQNKVLLVSVGRLDHQKDPLLLLSAFKQLTLTRSDLQLLMIGDGVLRKTVDAAVRELALEEHVTLLGNKSPVEIARHLHCADIFVLSSAYEGMPIAVLEALACGLPVVTTDVGEVGLVVTNGVNGQIADSRSQTALSAAMHEVLNATQRLSGHPCVEAVRAYRPEVVLSALYENHRRQVYGPSDGSS